MKRYAIAALIAAATLSLSPAMASDLAVSVNIGQPGFYGRIDIGGYPPPNLIYRQPMLVEPVGVVGPPIYLRVPPGHAKHWKRYCYDYGACGQRVYFVRDEWYNRVYAPRYRERHGGPEWREEGRRGDWDRGHERHDRHDHDRGHGRDHDRGEGRGHGRDR